MNKKEIKFTDESTFLGRNGEFKSTGLSILNPLGDELRIKPITSKDQLGRCTIGVPLSSVPELIKALKDMLEDTIPQRQQRIDKIKSVIREWGSTSCCELELDHSPSMNSLAGGKVCELVEQFHADEVETVVYDDENEIDWNTYKYEELSDEIIDEIYWIIDQYEAEQIKTEKRCQS